MTYSMIQYKNKSAIFLMAVLGVMAILSSPVQAQSAFDDPGTRSSSGTVGDFTAVEAKIDAGAVALGSSSQVVVLMRNDGSKPITSGAISLYPSSNVSASVGENECLQQPLPTDAVCAISISVKGLQPGRFRIEMLMRHDGRTKLITSTISGTVERSTDSTADIISDLEIIPSALDFKTLKDSRPLTRSVILRNVTSKEINISSMRIDSNEQAGYSLDSACEKLLSGEACIATITWAPQQRGPATGVMVVNHDGPTGVISVVLDGEFSPEAASEVGVFPEAVPGKGLLTASQKDIDFGSGIESASSITVSLVNVGDAPLEMSDIYLSNNDNGIRIEKTGCRDKLVLQPVEACPLTLTWEPVREGAILDDIQIRHDGARGILVLPVRGQADKVVNKDNKAVVMSGGYDGLLSNIPTLPASAVEGNIPASSKNNKEAVSQNPSASLDGFKVTSLAKNRAIISGPGGSRVVFDGQETVIGGGLWRVMVRPNAVELLGEKQRVLLLFDHSLSFTGSDTTTTSSSPAASSEGL